MLSRLMSDSLKDLFLAMKNVFFINSGLSRWVDYNLHSRFNLFDEIILGMLFFLLWNDLLEF